jgi:uncharacterized lipoprotein
MINEYDNDFASLVLEKLSTHPIWKFVKAEMEKRGFEITI